MANAEKNGTCNLCGIYGRLERSHIYPRAITKRAEQVVRHSLRNGGPDTSWGNAGWWDRIVCPTCERLFKATDDYAIDLHKYVMSLAGATAATYDYKMPVHADAAKLHTFAMTTWLRAHFSKKMEFAQVNDPNIADETVSHLREGRSTLESGRQLMFHFVCGELGNFGMSPRFIYAGDHPTYVLPMNHLHIYIAQTERGLPPGMSDIALSPSLATPQFYITRRPTQPMLDSMAPTFQRTATRAERMYATSGKGKATSNDD